MLLSLPEEVTLVLVFGFLEWRTLMVVRGVCRRYATILRDIHLSVSLPMLPDLLRRDKKRPLLSSTDPVQKRRRWTVTLGDTKLEKPLRATGGVPMESLHLLLSPSTNDDVPLTRDLLRLGERTRRELGIVADGRHHWMDKDWMKYAQILLQYGQSRHTMSKLHELVFLPPTCTPMRISVDSLAALLRSAPSLNSLTTDAQIFYALFVHTNTECVSRTMRRLVNLDLRGNCVNLRINWHHMLKKYLPSLRCIRMETPFDGKTGRPPLGHRGMYRGVTLNLELTVRMCKTICEFTDEWMADIKCLSGYARRLSIRFKDIFNDETCPYMQERRAEVLHRVLSGRACSVECVYLHIPFDTNYPPGSIAGTLWETRELIGGQDLRLLLDLRRYKHQCGTCPHFGLFVNEAVTESCQKTVRTSGRVARTSVSSDWLEKRWYELINQKDTLWITFDGVNAGKMDGCWSSAAADWHTTTTCERVLSLTISMQDLSN
jgi:hypothetical protein